MIIYVCVKKELLELSYYDGYLFSLFILLNIDYISKNHMAWLVINIRKGLKRKNFCTFWIQPITNILERKKPYFIYVLIIIHLKDIHWIWTKWILRLSQIMITSNSKIQSIFTFYTRCRDFSEGTILFRAWMPHNSLMKDSKPCFVLC